RQLFSLSLHDALPISALDVAYLLPLWARQTERLKEQGRLEWLQEDCSRLGRQYEAEISGAFDDYYLSFKGAWQFGPHQRAALQRSEEHTSELQSRENL